MKYKIAAAPANRATFATNHGQGIVYLVCNEAWPREWGTTLMQAPILSQPIQYTGTSAFRNIDLLSVISLMQLAKRLVQLYPHIQQQASRYRWDTPQQILRNANRMSRFLKEVSGKKQVTEQLEFVSRLATDRNLPPLPAITATVVDWNPLVIFFWQKAQKELFLKSDSKKYSGKIAKQFKMRFSKFYTQTLPIYYREQDYAKSTLFEKRRAINGFAKSVVHNPDLFLFPQSPLLLHFGIHHGCALSAAHNNFCLHMPPSTPQEAIRIAYVSNIHDHLGDEATTHLLTHLQDNVQPNIIIASRRQNPLQGTTDSSDHPSKIFTTKSDTGIPVIDFRKFICEVRI